MERTSSQMKNILRKNSKLTALCISFANLFDQINICRFQRSTPQYKQFPELYELSELDLDMDCERNDFIKKIIDCDEILLPNICVEIYIKCNLEHSDWNENYDATKMLIERWYFSQLTDFYVKSNWDRMHRFFDDYLRRGEVAQFIDKNPVFKPSFHMTINIENTSKFIDDPINLRFPPFSWRHDMEVLHVQVEWIPLRSNIIRIENKFFYESYALKNAYILSVPELQSEESTPSTLEESTLSTSKRNNSTKSIESSSSETKKANDPKRTALEISSDSEIKDFTESENSEARDSFCLETENSDDSEIKYSTSSEFNDSDDSDTLRTGDTTTSESIEPGDQVSENQPSGPESGHSSPSKMKDSTTGDISFRSSENQSTPINFDQDVIFISNKSLSEYSPMTEFESEEPSTSIEPNKCDSSNLVDEEMIISNSPDKIKERDSQDSIQAPQSTELVTTISTQCDSDNPPISIEDKTSDMEKISVIDETEKSESGENTKSNEPTNLQTSPFSNRSSDSPVPSGTRFEINPSLLSPDEMSIYLQQLRLRRKKSSAVSNILNRNLEGPRLENLLIGSFRPSGCISEFSVDLCCYRNKLPAMKHLPLLAFFFDESINTPDLCPYLGFVDLRSLGLRYRIPSCGKIQLLIFNPCQLLKKILLIDYDLSQMPPNEITYIRHKLIYAPIPVEGVDMSQHNESLQYCVHINVKSNAVNKKFLFGEIRIIFPSQPLELEDGEVDYEMITQLEGPFESSHTN